MGVFSFFQELFPANKRSCGHFAKYFTDAGLKELSDVVKNQQSVGARKELQKELQQQISCGEPLKDVGLLTFSCNLVSQGFHTSALSQDLISNKLQHMLAMVCLLCQ